MYLYKLFGKIGGVTSCVCILGSFTVCMALAAMRTVECFNGMRSDVLSEFCDCTCMWDGVASW